MKNFGIINTLNQWVYCCQNLTNAYFVKARCYDFPDKVEVEVDHPWIQDTFDVRYLKVGTRKKKCLHKCNKKTCTHPCCIAEYNGKDEEIVMVEVTKKDGTTKNEVIIRQLVDGDEDGDSFWENDEEYQERNQPEKEKRISRSQQPTEIETMEMEVNELDTPFGEKMEMVGRRIKVWWADDDGRRWEEGEIIRRKRNSKILFDVKYDFLCGHEDEEVVENLAGAYKEKWTFV